jgi:hypothetical protein
MLMRDDNMMNCATSDVITVLYSTNLGTKEAKSMFAKFNNNSGKLIAHSYRIRLHLTQFEGVPTFNNSKYYFIYELEFF